MWTNKTKILWWIIALLATLNITTIVTIVVNNLNGKKKAGAEVSIIVDPETRPINGKYFRHELGFDNDQMDAFQQSNRTFNRKANKIVEALNNQKELMFEELQAPNPDSIKISAISTEIGRLHTQLKEATAQFYLSLTKVCSAEQKEKMKEIFTPLFINLPTKTEGQGGRHGATNEKHDH